MKITENDLKRMQGRVKAGAHGVHLWIGIDPGVSTGVAIWCSPAQRFYEVTSMLAVEAEEKIRNVERNGTVHVVVEDTRNLRLPAKLQSSNRLKGAGSVHRDMGRWQEFLTHHKIPYTMAGLSPKEFREGNDAWFRAKTGWDKRTNEHARCAAGLVWMR